jgi:2-polyprenyl-3-methyl-5-hydroxy-6-metoxy-1,4-benzoquinol methylase
MMQSELERRCPVTGQPSTLYCRKDSANYFINKQSGIIFLGEMPDSRKMETYANDQFKDGAYRDYLEAKDLKVLTANERLDRIARYNSGKKLLDIGSAAGFFLEAAKSRGFEVQGIEFAAAAIAAASPTVRNGIIQGDIQEVLGRWTNEFDVITAFDIIEHMYDPVKFVSDIKKALKPGGLLVISTPDTGHYLRYLMGSRWSMLQPFQHTVLFSRDAMKQMLTSNGFTDVKVEATHKFLTPLYLAKQLKETNRAISAAMIPVLEIAPSGLTARPFRVNIGEFIAFARKRMEE